jgi:hypothetical protein
MEAETLHGCDRDVNCDCRWCPGTGAPSWNAIEKSLFNRLRTWLYARSLDFYDMDCGMQAHYLLSHLHKYLPLEHEAKAVGINPEVVVCLATHALAHIRFLIDRRGEAATCTICVPEDGVRHSRQHMSMRYLLLRTCFAPTHAMLLKAYILRGDLIVGGDLWNGDITGPQIEAEAA